MLHRFPATASHAGSRAGRTGTYPEGYHRLLVPFLCGWYVYLAILATLMAASAGGRTAIGRLAQVATAVAVVQLVMLYWVPRALRPGIVPIRLGADAFLLAVGLIGLLRAPRQDTKLIALLLAFVSLLPLGLYFYQPSP